VRSRSGRQKKPPRRRQGQSSLILREKEYHRKKCSVNKNLAELFM
jgi:hypothetical protein